MDLTTFSLILGILLAISEGLTLLPQFRSNGIFQLIFQVLRAIAVGIQNKEKE